MPHRIHVPKSNKGKLLCAAILGLLIWGVFGWIFSFGCGPFSCFFGKTGNLENVFAPQAAFFSAIAAIGAVYAIWNQQQQFQRQHFEVQFGIMLESLRQTRNQIKFPIFDTESAQHSVTQTADIFKPYLDLFQEIAHYFDPEKVKKPKSTILDNNSECKKQFEDLCDDLRDEDGTIQGNSEKRIQHAYRSFEEITQRSLWPYFKTIYRTLKFIDRFYREDDAKWHVAILRAQFSAYEQAVLYYNGLLHKDYDQNGKSRFKFKELIEKHCFLHGYEETLLFDAKAAGQYANSAFHHCD
ncbi:putative phage abortive infection protein [Paucidesulfovibrio gracilis]|uniref:putative phage abortive infection protein n=1 Tax=Paucidesulfovibrio gracilis TaxID=47158 RepID=UPI0013565F9D|nr:putative phage abortive infection protein [Paucidesulfovibrio gracilis]